jgi:phospholipase/carboxylesterase
MVPFEPEAPLSLEGKNVLLSAGQLDQMIPAPRAERLATILRKAGANVELVWQPASHGLTPGDVKAGQRFFEGMGHLSAAGI